MNRAAAGACAMVTERRSVAALEFALVAPILAMMTVGTFDLARAFIIWQQLNDSAEAIAEAAEKLSVTTDANGAPDMRLSQAQIQAAMSTIYAEIPGLHWGDGKGIFPGGFAVTLSSIQYLPACAQTNQCTPQAPITVWSSYLTEGGSQLNQGAPASQLFRLCGKGRLTGALQFPNNNTQLSVMIVPDPAIIGQVPLTPQMVADVRYDFTPSFPLAGFLVGARSFTLWASATLPTPLGSLTKPVAFDPGQGIPPANVEVCSGGNPPQT